jgi:hypothetical protein
MHLTRAVVRTYRNNSVRIGRPQGRLARKGSSMFATAPLARVVALTTAVLVTGASPVLAVDTLADRAIPQIDFTLADTVPFVPSVATVIPPALLTDASVEPKAAPIAEAAQNPIDLRMPGVDGTNVSTSLRRSMYVSFAALQIMDGISTRKALNNGASEANPAMSGLARNSAALFAVKAGTAAATTYFAERLSKNHPRAATIMMAVLNTAYAAVVAHNYRVARR